MKSVSFRTVPISLHHSVHIIVFLEMGVANAASELKTLHQELENISSQV